MISKKILVCYNKPTSFYGNYVGKETESEIKIDLSERGLEEQIEFICSALKDDFSDVHSFAVSENFDSLIAKLNSYSPNAIFNFVESIEGNSDFESYCAGFFDILGYSYTGNSSLTLGNCLLKERTKQILIGNGIKTPDFNVFKIGDKISRSKFKLSFPVILKLASEDASIGISELSVVDNFSQLKKRLEFLFKNYNQDVIAEEYIKGRELNISILGDEILPISEISFDGLSKELPKIITYEAKWSPESEYYNKTQPICPALLSDQVRKKVEDISLRAFKALNCRDYARVDIRLAKRNVPYVIEVNPNPDISLDSGFVRSAKAADIDYNELLKRIINFALKRSAIYD